MQRVLVSPSSPGGLRIGEADCPEPLRNEALIRVTAFSLNRGELAFYKSSATEGSHIGWDFTGVIEQPAADGSSPPVGTRVVGWRPEMDAWAEYIAVTSAYFAPIPDGISDAHAATLPVAGLTALYSLDKGKWLVGNNVLVTGVTGGVGGFALQLAKASGAFAVAHVRKEEQVAVAKSLGADDVVVSPDGDGLDAHGPYQLIIDGVGGDLFQHLMPQVSKGGILVCYGITGGPTATLNIYPDLFGGAAQRSVYGLGLYTEVEHQPSNIGLGRLLRLLQRGQLRTTVALEKPWQEVSTVAEDFLARKITGKAVLFVEKG